MKKTILIVLLVVLVVVGGGFFYVLTQANSIIAKLKPEIEKQGSTALNTDLTIGEIDFSAFPNTSLTIDGLKLTDPSDSSKTLSVSEGRIKIGLLPLLSGQVKVDSFSLVEPAISITQTKKGIQIHGMKAAGNKGKKKERKKQQEAKKEPAAKAGASSGLPSWLSVNLDTIRIVDGTISFTPLVGEPIVIQDFNVQTGVALAGGDRVVMAGLSLDAVMKDKMKTDLKMTQGSVSLQSLSGSLKEINANVQLTEQDLSVKTKISGLSFNGKEPSAKLAGLTLETALPELEKVVLTLTNFSYAADGTAIFPDVTASLLKGTAKINGEYNVNTSSGKIDTTYKEIQYHGESFGGKATIIARQGNFTLKDAALDAFGTSILPTGGAKPFAETFPFFGKVTTENLDIGRAVSVAVQGAEPPLTGNLVNLEADAEGALKPDPVAALKANAKLEIKDGEFTGGNLPALVLQSMKDIPFLNRAIFSDVPKEYQDELDGDTTPIKSLKSDINILNKVIAVRSVSLESTIFSLTAKGTVGFDQALNLETTFRFAPAFSLALTNKIDELENLLDEKDRMVIPLQLKGTAMEPTVLPNMKEIMKLGAGEAIKKEGSKLIGKLIGEKREDVPEGEKSEAEKITEDVGKLFGF